MVSRLVRQSRFWSLVAFAGLCAVALVLVLHRPTLPPEPPAARAQGGGSTTDTPTPEQAEDCIDGHPLWRLQFCANASYFDPPYVCSGGCPPDGPAPSDDGPLGSGSGGAHGPGSCHSGACAGPPSAAPARGAAQWLPRGGGGPGLGGGGPAVGPGGPGGPGGGPGTQTCPPGPTVPDGMVSDTASLIDNFTFNYIHWGDDLHASGPNPWMTARLRRYYRSRDVAHNGSFGPGWFCNYDIHLRITHDEDEYGEPLVDDAILFDATAFYPRRLVMGSGFVYAVTPNVPLGTLHILQSNGAPATNFSEAAFAELRQPTGGLFRFELYAEQSQSYVYFGGEIDEWRWVGDAQLLGRLVRMQDPLGYGTTLTYQAFDPEDLEESPERWLQIDEVTGDDGTGLAFTYLEDQVGGRWAVDAITASYGGTVDYDYDSGWLDTVTLPDESVSTFTYDYNSTAHTDVVTFDDAASQGTHRRKRVYFSVAAGAGDPPYLIGTSARLVRMVVSDDEEVTYMNMWDLNFDPYTEESAYGFVYLGSGKLLKVREYRAVSAFQDGWYFDLENSASHAFAVVGETDAGAAHTYYNPSPPQWYPVGRPYEVTDERGLTRHFTYNAAGWPTKVAYADSTYETYCYNSLQQVTRYRDRLGRVTKSTYNAKGNRLTLAVGLVEAENNTDPCATDDVETDEYAVYEWEYYGDMDDHPWLLAAAIDPDGRRTDYAYDANHRLETITEPPDEEEGDRAVTTFTYDAAGRVAAVADALERVTEYFYDDNGRLWKVVYDDGSEERFVHGTGAEANLLVKHRDRRGIVTAYEYDASGRRTRTVFAAATMDLSGMETEITDPAVRQAETVTYLTGTNLPLTRTRAGDLTEYAYDYRHRLVATTVHPNTGTDLTTEQTYVDNQLFATADPYGRRTFYAYDATDGRLIRTIKGTVPSVEYEDFEEVLEAERDADGTPNSTSIITDYLFDAAGQLTATVDPRGYEHTSEYDSRGRVKVQIRAAGTDVAARTETDYDLEGRVVAVRHPRYFDEEDTDGYEACQTVLTYTGRGLLASRTEAPGTGVAAAESFAYDLVGRQTSRTDFRGKTWLHQEPECCGRVILEIDPLGHGTISQTDEAGHVTHQATVADVSSHENASDPIDGKTLREVTTRYDARGRVSARTVWLVPLEAVDPADPPIYDMASAMGDPDGLTTAWTYDDDLTDETGLDDEFSEHLAGLNLGAGSDGAAVLVTNPQGERTLSIKDGLGRTVRVVQLAQNGDALTQQTIAYDAVVEVDGYGDVVETVSANLLDHATKQRSDGVGRTIASVDQADFVTSYAYDAAGNRLSVRDPNDVGEDCVYDELGRRIECADTQEQIEEANRRFAYDRAGNLVTQTDAKEHDTVYVFDARNRRISLTDRIAATTAWTYDDGGLELSMTDAEEQTTAYEYDDVGRRIKTTWPDHEAMSSPGDSGYGITEVAYDQAGQVLRKTDQLGDTLAFEYDLAGRMLARQHRTRVNSPSGTVASADAFTYDWAGRLLTAVSGLYSNTVTRTYDEGGRLATESLAALSQTYAVGQTYDEAGRLYQITYPDGSVVTRTYTPRGQLEEVTYTPNGGSPQTLDSRTYDDGGRLDEETHGNSLVTNWSYRADNLATGISNSTVGNLTYDYDENKNPTEETWSGVMADYSWTAGYDDQDRLTSWQRGAGDSQSWDLTPVGDWDEFTENMVAQTRTHGPAHELTAIGMTSLSYDAKGNLTEDHEGKDYTWDCHNMLASVTVPMGASGIEGTHTYAYDALQRRVSKTVNAGTMSAETTVFVCRTEPIPHSPYAGQELAEYPSGTAASSPLRKYVFASYIDEPVAMIDRTALGSTGAGSDELFYYHRSRLYNVVALSDGSGDVIERAAYTPYGETLLLDASATTPLAVSAVGNASVFTGRRDDHEVALVFFRARRCSPTFGRFVARDPLGYLDSESTNLCEYVNGRPLTRLDPSGFSEVSYIGFSCWCLCGLNGSSINSAAQTAMQSGYDSVKDKGWEGGDPRNRALRHCVAAGNLARLTGSCDCADCLATFRETYQVLWQGQSNEDRQRAINNNDAGLDCAGCKTIAVGGHHPLTRGRITVGPSATEQQILNCCEKKLADGELDTSGPGGPPAKWD